MITVLTLAQQTKSQKQSQTQTLNLPTLITGNLHTQLLQTIISLNLFFCAIENPFFQTLLEMLSPDCISQLPGQTKLHDLLNEQHQETMKNILSDQESGQKTLLA